MVWLWWGGFSSSQWGLVLDMIHDWFSLVLDPHHWLWPLFTQLKTNGLSIYPAVISLEFFNGKQVPDFETETNRDSQSTFERVSGWSSRSGTREYFPTFAGLVGSVQENIFLYWLVYSVRYQRIFSFLGWSLVGPVQENIFPTCLNCAPPFGYTGSVHPFTARYLYSSLFLFLFLSACRMQTCFLANFAS